MSPGNVRALVLGASGFIGRWIARLLQVQGAELFVTARDLSHLAPVQAEYGFAGEAFELDATDEGALERVLRAARPTVVFNAIGYGVDPSERDELLARRINSDFVEALAKRLAPAQRLVHIGSALEYGIISGDLAETSTPQPTTLYGRTKLEGTERLRSIALQAGLRALTARLFTVYGPGEHEGRLLPTLIRASRSTEPLRFTSGTQRRDFTYVEDAARALLLLAASERTSAGDIVNVATGRLSSVRELIETAIEVLAISPDRVLLGAIPQRPEEMRHDPVATSHLRSLISWIPDATIEEGLRRTMRFRHMRNPPATP